MDRLLPSARPMPHPPISEIFAHAGGDARPEIAAHLDGCALCRQLAGLGDPLADRALIELVTVDPALYGRRHPIGEARGGMGRAFRAWDRRLGREVVIKQIRAPEDPDARAALRARFEREARVTARLAHPGIVGVLELGRWPDGEPFYTMPLVEGVPLDVALAEAEDLAARLALLPRLTAAAEAIAFAHDRGVVHRDVKPANVILGRFGETVVIDWGLATALADREDGLPAPFRDEPPLDDGLTRYGVGTPQYMAPEQAAGAAADPRADVYALGATLYHLLAGAPPYPPAPLRDGPPELIAICERALARDPAARFATALELAAELRRYQTGQLVASHRYGAGAILRRWARRHRAALAVGAAALAALAAVAALAVTNVVRERDRARAALARARGAQASALAADAGRRLEAIRLAATALAAAGDEPADEIVQGLVDALTAGPAPLPLPVDDAVVAVAYAPAGDRFVTVGGDGVARAWDARRGVELAALDATAERPFWAVWSGDGEHVAITALDDTVDLWRPATGARHALPAGGAGAAQPTAFAAFDGRGALVTAAGDGTLRRWDVATGERTAEARAGCAAASLAIAGARALVACADGALVAWDGDAAPLRLEAHAGLAHLAVAPGGDAAYTGGFDGRVLAWELAGAAPVARVLAAPGAQVWGLHVSPDGGALAVSTGALALIELAGDGRHVDAGLQLQHAPPPPGAPRWFGHAAGREIVALDVASRRRVLHLRGHRAFDRAAIAGSPDGDRVVSATGAGETWLWDARLGAATGLLPEHAGEVVALAPGIGVAVDGSIWRGAAPARAGTELAVAATDGARVIAGGADGRARVVEPDGAIRVVGAGARPVSAVAIRGDAIAFGDLAGVVTIGARAHATGDPVAAIAIGDGAVASGHASGAVRVWRDGALAETVAGDAPVVALLATGDGFAVGRAGDRGARPDGTAFRGVPVAASPTGALAIADLDGGIAIDGGPTLAARGPRVVAAAFSPDGAHLYTAHASGELQAWDARAGRRRFTIADRGLGPATTLTATADGHLLVGHATGAARAHPVTIPAMRARACAALAAFALTCP